MFYLCMLSLNRIDILSADALPDYFSYSYCHTGKMKQTVWNIYETNLIGADIRFHANGKGKSKD